MQKLTFETRERDGLKTVTGYAVDNSYSLKTAMYRCALGSWCVVELSTGLAMAWGDTRTEASQELARVVAKHTLPKIREIIESQLDHLNLISQV